MALLLQEHSIRLIPINNAMARCTKALLSVNKPTKRALQNLVTIHHIVRKHNNVTQLTLHTLSLKKICYIKMIPTLQ